MLLSSRAVIYAVCKGQRLASWARVGTLAGALAATAAAFSAVVPDAQAQVEQARPWLGVAIDEGKSGVLVKDIVPDTPAAGAGLQAGDEITAINDKAVKKPAELINAVQTHGVGTTVSIHFLRAGKAETKTIKLVARPDQLEVIRKQLVDRPAPPFALELIHGADKTSTKELLGQVVVVEFWATWCPACRATHPQLSKFAAAQRGKGIAVIAISDEDAPTIKAYAAETKPAFTIARDGKQETQKDWLVNAIPMLVVIDKAGIVRFATIGAGEYLDEALAVATKLAAAK